MDLIRRAKRDRTYLVGSPTGIMMSDITFPTFREIARDLGVLGEIKLTPWPTITMTTGATIRFRSAEDPEKMRGPNLSGVWLDEASLMKPEVFQIVIACLREANTQGWLSATFTPKGLAHWTYDKFGCAKDFEGERVELFHAQTRDNPFIPKEFQSDLAQDYSDSMISQELEGLFIDADDAWQVIPTGWIRASMDRWRERKNGNSADSAQAQTCIGVDVARGGADATVISARWGNWFAPLKYYKGHVTNDGEKAAQLVLREWQEGATINVDAIGLGASCYDFLKRDKPGKLAVAMNVAESTEEFDRTRKYKFRNIRSAMYWKLREALDPDKGDNLQLPNDMDLLIELSAPRFEVTASGLQVEKKEETKKRLPKNRSPDKADAVCLAHYQVRKWKFNVGFA